tara:strand:+ start:19680 stop:21116 length:1437 start_codon:yes stop_codon:yes gene_type:complete
MSGPIKLSEIAYGSINELTDTRQSQLTGDRRRTPVTTTLRRSTTQAYQPDTIGPKSEYAGFIVSSRAIQYPSYQNKASMFQAHAATDLRDGDAGTAAAQSPNIAYKVYIPELEPRPAPRGQADPVLRTYPDVFSGLSTDVSLPIGALVVVQYGDPQTLRNPQIVRIISKSVPIENISIDKLGNWKGPGFSAGGGSVTTMGDAKEKENLVYTLKVSSPPLIIGTANDVVRGQNTPINGSHGTLQEVVEAEFDFWKEKKEDDSAETRERVHKYNTYIYGKRSAIKSGSNFFHWSAIFVSWVINQVDPTFPTWTAHTLYAAAAKRGVGGWSLWMTPEPWNGDSNERHAEHKIQANIGDVFLQPPTGKRLTGKRTNSHADVVYKIEPEDGQMYAYLAGGNLNNTATSPGKLSVDGEGNYTSWVSRNAKNPYQLVIKKHGTLWTKQADGTSKPTYKPKRRAKEGNDAQRKAKRKALKEARREA